MKKCLIILTTLLYFNNIRSQVLYNETFSSYTLGNLGTDYTGVVPGQGGWLTEIIGANTPTNNSYFNITSEAGKGNVLVLNGGTAVPTQVAVIAKKINIDALINQRTPGNNVIKFEIDYYTGGQQSANHYSNRIILGDNATGNIGVATNQLIEYNFHPDDGLFYVSGKDLTKNIKLDKNASLNSKLPFNTWVTFIVYLDYNNKKAYFETPYFNTIAVGDFLKTKTSTNLIEDFKPTVLAFMFAAINQTTTVGMVNKYDNIKITALKNVPAYVLSAENFLAAKFNIYPNPATNVVNITNSENMQMQQVAIYDIAGKPLSTQSFNNQTEVQLNVENLASGTYMLHLETNQGMAVKKLVKK